MADPYTLPTTSAYTASPQIAQADAQATAAVQQAVYHLKSGNLPAAQSALNTAAAWSKQSTQFRAQARIAPGSLNAQIGAIQQQINSAAGSTSYQPPARTLFQPPQVYPTGSGLWMRPTRMRPTRGAAGHAPAEPSSVAAASDPASAAVTAATAGATPWYKQPVVWVAGAAVAFYVFGKHRGKKGVLATLGVK